MLLAWQHHFEILWNIPAWLKKLVWFGKGKTCLEKNLTNTFTVVSEAECFWICLLFSKMGILLILQQLKVRILLPWECVGWIFMRRHTSVSFFRIELRPRPRPCPVPCPCPRPWHTLVSFFLHRTSSSSSLFCSTISTLIFVECELCQRVCFSQHSFNDMEWWGADLLKNIWNILKSFK